MPKNATVRLPGREVEQRAREAFGFEWRRRPTFGLEGPAELPGADFTRLRDAFREHLLAHTLAAFWRKTLLAPEEVAGKDVLDAGCGNGRYAVAAALAAARVILAIDPSDAASVAWANLAEFPNVLVKQFAIDELNVEPGSFHAIFCIGVLQHLADPAAAVRKLADLLATGGVLSVHVYRRRNAASRLACRLVRPLTSRLPPKWLWRLCAVPTVIGKLTLVSRYAHAAANLLLPCFPTMQQNFDWYAPRLANQFEPAEVRAWLADAGLVELADDDPFTRADSYYNRLYPAWMKRADGRLRPWVGRFFGPMGLTVRGRKRE